MENKDLELRTVFNESATGHLTQHYPLFFGEQMGTYDTVNRNYPTIFDLYNRQISQLWFSSEVDVTQDRIDLLKAPKDVVDLMIKTIQWQQATDSVAARSVGVLLERWVTNPEMSSLIKAWGLFEDIHSQSYADIVATVFPNPNDMVNEIVEDLNIVGRSRVLIDVFDNLYNMSDNAPIEEKRKNMLLAFAAFYAMESISFMASFTVTFTIAHTGFFAGIGERVRFIARDEQTHQHFAYEALRIMRDVEKYPEWEECLPEMKRIIDTVLQQELDWNKYLFKDKEVLGLNEEVMEEAIKFFSYPVYYKMGLEVPFEKVDNPIQHIIHYFDTSLIQTASQEIQQTAYSIGSMLDDGYSSADLNVDIKKMLT